LFDQGFGDDFESLGKVGVWNGGVQIVGRGCARWGGRSKGGRGYTDFLNVELFWAQVGGLESFWDIIRMPMPASKALQKSALQSRSLSPLVGQQEFCGIAISWAGWRDDRIGPARPPRLRAQC